MPNFALVNRERQLIHTFTILKKLILMIQFITTGKKNFQTKETKYYAQIAPVLPTSLNDVIAQIERECTVAAPDVLAVLNALQHVIVQELRNGHAVHLGELGSFRPTLLSNGALTAKEVCANNIKRVRCRFTPSAVITRALDLGNVNFQLYKAPFHQPSGPEHL